MRNKKYRNFFIIFICVVTIITILVNFILILRKDDQKNQPQEVLASNHQLLTALNNRDEELFEELLENKTKSSLNLSSLTASIDSECFDIEIIKSLTDISGDYKTNQETVYFEYDGELLCNAKDYKIHVKYNYNYKILGIEIEKL